MRNKINIEDDSGDRKYFTIIPNYILNHSTLYDREVYIQMKRITGEDGTCWTSQSTLAKQCGVSINRLKKSIKYLVDHKWITQIGTKKVGTRGGFQEVNEYRIADLWKMNVEFYENKKGVSPNDIPLSKGVSRDEQRGITDEAKGVSPEAYKEEPYLIRTHKEDVAIATTPKDKATSFFLMVKENGQRYSNYLTSLNAPEEIARREIDKFTAYWTELNATGTKQRWEKEPTFEVLKRLKTWINGSKEFKGSFTSKYKATSI